jgi:hypothetical protein
MPLDLADYVPKKATKLTFRQYHLNKGLSNTYEYSICFEADKKWYCSDDHRESEQTAQKIRDAIADAKNTEGVLFGIQIRYEHSTIPRNFLVCYGTPLHTTPPDTAYPPQPKKEKRKRKKA